VPAFQGSARLQDERRDETSRRHEARKEQAMNETVKDTSKTAIFYHAGCPVCVDAERSVANAIDGNKYRIEIVHLGEQKGRVAEAEAIGVKSVPALVLDGVPFHINFGAPISALK
jgi:hypothetical protein